MSGIIVTGRSTLAISRSLVASRRPWLAFQTHEHFYLDTVYILMPPLPIIKALYLKKMLFVHLCMYLCVVSLAAALLTSLSLTSDCVCNNHNHYRLQPLYRLTCVSRHFRLRTGGFCWCKVLLPACRQPVHSD